METTPRSHHLPSSFFFILLLTIYLLPVSSSTKTETPKSSNKATTSVAVELIHADANNKLTYQQHIHAALRRTQHRAVQHMLDTKRGGYHRLNSSPLPQQAATVEMPLRGYQAEYLMTLAIGTPPTSLSATIDTGSTLIWTRCYQPTNTQHQPVFDPQNSSSYSKVPCSDPICKVNDVLSGCNGVDCSFMAQYADRSTSTGLLGWETFTLGSNSMRVKVGFGCSFRTKGFESFDTAGIVGFNRGSLSLISQLGPMIDHQFSYCLGGYSSSNQSKLTLGPIDRSIIQNATTFAPLLVNPVAPEHYFVALLGISVGGKRLPISDSAFRFHSDGSGGVVVDSGSTLTGLVQEAYRYKLSFRFIPIRSANYV